MKWLLLIIGLLLLIFIEILKVYLIMPFPGSQEDETIRTAYFLHSNIIYFRLLGWAMIAYPVVYFFRTSTNVVKITLAVVLGFYVVVFYKFNFQYLADKIFREPSSVVFLGAGDNKHVLAKQLVIGVSLGGESKAFPIEIIGYHHQVRDVIGNVPVMVTYCTVCRTGRVFSPVVDGKEETFRLVGMDHFNAMFEDNRTRTWWRQVNGEAVVGPLRGKSLAEIPSEQMSLLQWTYLHPDTKILQPDSTFKEAYDRMKDYDEGKSKQDLTRKDSLSWKDKSWIVGLQIGMDARAYDWTDLLRVRTINDRLGDTPVLVAMGPDSISFHSFNRIVDNDTLSFVMSNDAKLLKDTKTDSQWDWNGRCVSGSLQGRLLAPLQSYQEYWHSWRTFRPQTTRYEP